MFREANNFCLRLWKDDSGVVLAITLVVFLALFMMACSVYSVGETVRLRIELQNACDSAAYSAAAVQADALSRIGAINRAMVWTYAQLVKRDMDLIVDSWIREAFFKHWLPDRIIADLINRMGCDYSGMWLAGCMSATTALQLNRKYVVPADMVLQCILGFMDDRIISLAMIESYKTSIDAMNTTEDEIMNALPDRIEKAVIAVLEANIADTWNDTLSPAEHADIMYVLDQSTDPMGDYIDIEDKEEEFFALADIKPHKPYLGPGFDLWFKQKPAAGGGMFHAYEEQADYLVADWYTMSVFGLQLGEFCIPILVINESLTDNEVWAHQVTDPAYFETVPARAHKLKDIFFGKVGTIVVGLSRRMNNPFQFVVPGLSPGDRSMYEAFTLDDDRRFMWTAAAARAGYWLPGTSVEDGDYQITYWRNDPPDVNVMHWNIKWSDWDAVLLPLRRAWTQGVNGEWLGGPTAAQILSSVSGGSWTALPSYGGSGALGPRSSPQLMAGGAEPGPDFTPGDTRKFVYH